MIDSFLLRGEADIQLIRDFLTRLPDRSTVVDFEENIRLASIRSTTRLWRHKDKLIGFAYIDDFNNLRFEIDLVYRSAQLDQEIIAWGIACIQMRNAETGAQHTLDASVRKDHLWQIAFLEEHGFVRSEFRTLLYVRSLRTPIIDHSFPSGFTWRSVAGEQEVPGLVALHRAAFGTNLMTSERRLAIMQAPYYKQDLDLVAVAPNGSLAAFCICGFGDERVAEPVGFTDPIGTHPLFQRRGLSKALVTAGLLCLREREVARVELNTSSNNLPMQRLAETLGYTCVSEKLWFSKEVIKPPNKG